MENEKKLGYKLVIETLQTGGYYVAGGIGPVYGRRGRYIHVPAFYCLHAKDGRYVGSFTVATRDATSKRVKLSYNEASRRVTLAA